MFTHLPINGMADEPGRTVPESNELSGQKLQGWELPSEETTASLGR